MTIACASVCLFMMDYFLWRLDLKGVTLEKLHNNLAKRHLNKYKNNVAYLIYLCFLCQD